MIFLQLDFYHKMHSMENKLQLPSCVVKKKTDTLILPKMPTKIAVLPTTLTPKVTVPKSPGLVVPKVIMTPKRTLTPVAERPVPMAPLARKSATPGPKLSRDPWIPIIDDTVKITIIGIQPNGMLNPVPTSDKILMTPRKTLTPGKYLKLVVKEPAKDPVFSKAVYIRPGVSSEGTAQHMKSLTNALAETRKGFHNVEKSLISVKGKVSLEIFKEALHIYENNQVYYQDCIDDKSIPLQEVITRLRDLEYWFMMIIEPRDPSEPEAWIEHENFKFSKGYSYYCDTELYRYIPPMTQENLLLLKDLY